MDPMQVPNQQPIETTQQAQAPVQYVAQNIPQQVPMQQVPVQQVPVQQPVQQDSVFDKILKGIVDFIGKLAAPTPGTLQQPQGQIQQPVMQQPVQQVGQPIVQNTPQQTIPGADFFNKIGNTLDAIGNQAEKMVQTGTSNVIASTQNYVNEQPVASVDTQQFLTQNYQPNTQQPVPSTPTQPEVQQPQPEVQQPQPEVQQPQPEVQQPQPQVQQPQPEVQQPQPEVQQPQPQVQQPQPEVQQPSNPSQPSVTPQI